MLWNQLDLVCNHITLCIKDKTCRDPCCDATTCKLHSWVECESGECCEQCRFRTAGTECRARRSECDIAENCTGQSDDCPTDDFHRNGQPCLNNFGYCYNGNCPILYHQCYAQFGPNATVGEDSCFEKNRIGNDYGYCTKENGRKIACAPQDVKCGRLYCSYHSNRNLCVSSSGIVEPGTKCGDGKVCSNGQCIDVTTAY